MRLRIEIEREDDGRWIAEVVDLPGVITYGATHEAALASAKALSLRTIADKLEHDELGSNLAELFFIVVD